MNRICTFSWRFINERILDAGTVSAQRLIRLLGPEMAAAAYTLFANEAVLFEEWNCKFLLCNLH
jgi:hypothetical protein